MNTTHKQEQEQDSNSSCNGENNIKVQTAKRQTHKMRTRIGNCGEREKHNKKEPDKIYDTVDCSLLTSSK